MSIMCDAYRTTTANGRSAWPKKETPQCTTNTINITLCVHTA